MVKAVSLNEKEIKFVRAYIANGGNRSQAALDAGYCPSGSRQAAGVKGHKLLKMAKIQKAVERDRKEILASIGVTFLTQAQACVKTREYAWEGRGKKDGVLDLPAANHATDILNKMGGFYAPEKQEHSNSIVDLQLLDKLERDM